MKNQRLMASAGTGKTYALTNRYIGILLRQKKPERILAMTFTRKAAGEFFQKVLVKLCEAASHPKRAASLAKELDIKADSADFLDLLRIMVESMPRLQLSTFDSFFASLIRCFPLELGLPGVPEILPPEEVLSTQKRILSNALNHKNLSEQDLQNLSQIIAEMTAGRETASTLEMLLQLVNSSLHIFLECPDEQRWGNPFQIWKDSLFKQPLTREELDFPEALFQQTLQQTSTLGFNDRVQKALIAVLEELRNLHFTGKIENDSTLLKQLLASPENLASTSFTFTYYRKEYSLPDTFRKDLYTLLTSSLRGAFLLICMRTQARAKFLKLYLNYYEEESFRSGRFSFSDTARLLNPHSPTGNQSPISGTHANHELMHYRLDTRFDHWLLDEFQDTSRSQWNTIEPLINEILQDAEQQRSFFYVGDVKQCLYQWRGSDASLFEEIFNRYQPAILEGKPLQVSWRSRPEILETVNQVFGDHLLILSQTSPQVSSLWQKFWNEHSPANIHNERNRAYSSLEGYAKNDREAFYRRVVELLNTQQPLQRGLSVAILTRKNDHSREIADYLRSHTSYPVTVEADRSPFTDNVAGILLLQWITAALHPSDRAASGMLRFYHQDVAVEDIQKRIQQVRSWLFIFGLQQTISKVIPWVQHSLQQHLPNQPFPELLTLRFAQCQEAARLFDERRQTDPESFLEYAANFRVTDSSSAQSIQILTIHKSKGLDYDIVIVDIPDEKFLAEPRDPLLVSKNDAQQIEWVLEKPSAKICNLDAVLDQARTQLQEESAFGELCALYVAMTRARSGLHLFVGQTQSDRQTDSTSPATLVIEALATPQTEVAADAETKETTQQGAEPALELLYEHGNPEWFQSKELLPQEPPKQQEPIPHPPFTPTARLTRFLPSQEHEQEKKGEWYLSTSNTETRELGSDVHAFFERIEWLPEDSQQRESYLRERQHGLREELFQKLCNLLNQPDWGQFFNRPSTSSTESEQIILWREKAFSVILNDKWMNGVFDRVLLRYRGKELQSIDLVDFKTDRILDHDERQKKISLHQPQLQAYREALQILAGPVEIRTWLAFTEDDSIHQIACST